MVLRPESFGRPFDPDMGMQAIQDPMGLVRRLAQQGVEPPPDQEDGATPDDAHSSLGRLLVGDTQMAALGGPTVDSTGGATPAMRPPIYPPLQDPVIGQDQPRPGDVASPGLGESGAAPPVRLGAALQPVPMLSGAAADAAMGGPIGPPMPPQPIPSVPIGTTGGGEPAVPGQVPIGSTGGGGGGPGQGVPVPPSRPATVMRPTPPPAPESPNATGDVPVPRERPTGPGITPREDEGPEGDKTPSKSSPTSGKKDSFESKMDSLGKALAGLKPVKPPEPQKIYSPPPPRPAAQIARTTIPQQVMGEILKLSEGGNRRSLGDLLRGGR